MLRRVPLIALFAAVLLPVRAEEAPAERTPIPPDLMDDPHVREEMAVNEFTAPSIAKIFESLESLTPLPLVDHQRKLPEQTPLNRADIAVELGFLIANGFLQVQAGDLGDDKVEALARDLTRYSDSLGAGKRVTSHAAGLRDSAKKGNVEQLKAELGATQKDVERDLVELRDADLAHLISLGGWIRALEVSAAAVERQFSEERAKEIMREDIADYYASIVGSLEPRIAERPDFVKMRELLSAMRLSMLVEEGEVPTKEQAVEIRKQADQLAELALNRGEAH